MYDEFIFVLDRVEFQVIEAYDIFIVF